MVGYTAAGITFPATNTARRLSRAHDVPTGRAFPDRAAATATLGGAAFGSSHPAASAFLCHIEVLCS
jgi:hypothetical protein